MESMAEAAEATPPHHGLPDAIVIWEILVRLPPKPLLRCRAVCPAWRRATSTRDFLLAHHARQPTLPLLLHCSYDQHTADIIPFDHHQATAANDKLQPVARLNRAFFNVMASCDGLLVLSNHRYQFSICNPATREHAPLRQLDELMEEVDELELLGMYPHNPTGEYRLLGKLRFESEEEPYGYDYEYAIFTLGSSEPPRTIACPDEWEMHGPPVIFLGSMHWFAGHATMVFDTTAESFRQMRSPVVPPDDADLFEAGGTLGISVLKERATVMDIWMMQDYEGEVWALKHRVELPVADLKAQFGTYSEQWSVVIPSWNGDLFGLVIFREWLLQIDINGKVLASFHLHEPIRLTVLWLKQTLVQHPFFPTLEGYVVNESPFI